MDTRLPPNDEHIDHEMIKMEVNFDDISGEWLGYVMNLLFENGAMDVFYTPIYMKKNRPGTMLQLLCSQDRVDKMKEIIFGETTTLGIRYYPVIVHRLERSLEKVSTEWGMVTVKKGSYGGKTVQSAPEFEECKRIAKLHNIPLKHVYEQVLKQGQMKED